MMTMLGVMHMGKCATAEAVELKKCEVSMVLDCVADMGAEETAKVGTLTLPDLVLIESRVKPAYKAEKNKQAKRA